MDLNGSIDFALNGSNLPKGCDGKTVEEINDVDDHGIDQRYTICRIINGSEKFPGLIKLIIKVLATELIPQALETSTKEQIIDDVLRLKYYLFLIAARASGDIPTTAHWIRTR
ncbi:hypothetical protein Cantr_05768 [Candida viswanathii]|uniref:Uncharacterized protein n=1 Tax=Candida viswanathii TaxID=5486 RepID=A0A367XPX0_9ASCO|nr:hypothetical protein Cantr_05768 [Candida viswanathii]